jgi:alpha-N-acetylglucosaminidase
MKAIYNKTTFLLMGIGLLFLCSCQTMVTGPKPAPADYKAPILVGPEYKGTVDAETQRLAALGVITRLLGEKAVHFEVEIIPQENNRDVFEVESKGGMIILRGSDGVTACRALKWYLNEKCNCSISWRGDNLNLPDPLPRVPEKVRDATPFKYRYMFNYCTFGYEMAWWHWPEWERMIDVMAFNGINLPLALLGQEKAWQETYKEFGLTNKDLDDFFASPAYNAWQWMGNLDGAGGPLPQSVIDGHYELQKQILARSRALGMTPILQGFAGHVPNAMKTKYPALNAQKMYWQGYSSNILNWQDPFFVKIGATFLKKLNELYGTDHYYAVDPFNEMTPPSTENEYIENMGKTIHATMDAGDPKGISVLQTWFCKSPEIPSHYWQADRTKLFFDQFPDDRLLALELHAECWHYTGWRKQSGYYNKPWVWCVVQSWGGQIDLYGGLPQIVENYKKMQESPDKGRVSGIGYDPEGLGYNTVVFELLADMMWGDGVTDLDEWQKTYVLKRYGKHVSAAQQAWDILFATRYKIYVSRTHTILCHTPRLYDDGAPSMDMVMALKYLLDAADELQDSETYRFDLLHVAREVMGNYAPHFVSNIKKAYEAKDLKAFDQASAEFFTFANEFDSMLGSSKHFMMGPWTEGARSWGTTDADKLLLERSAKSQITSWVGGYAIKEWSGYFTSRMLPFWKVYLDDLRTSLVENREFTPQASYDKMAALDRQWLETHSKVPTEPQGNELTTTRFMWDKYGKALHNQGSLSGYVPPGRETGPGFAVGKKITATSVDGDHKPELAVDGKIDNSWDSWWSKGPGSLTIDLEKIENIQAFQVYFFWDGRHYQYTIEISKDGKKWDLAVDMSENTDPATPRGQLHEFKTVMPEGFDARYVRLNMLKNSANPGMHVTEIKLFRATDERYK